MMSGESSVTHKLDSKTLSNRRTAMYERYVAKLRLEDYDALMKFSKMHLSFLMDVDNERFSELFGEKNEGKAKLGNMFTKKKISNKKVDTSIHDKDYVISHHIEESVNTLISLLKSSNALKKEGLFRKSGNISRQRELKVKLDNQENLDLSSDSFSSHDCASVLKLLIGDLDEPLLLERLLQVHLYALDIKKFDQRLKFTSILLQMLPTSHYRIAKVLFKFLHEVMKCSSENRMTADSLGAIFAPNVLCSKKLAGSDLHNLASRMQSIVSFIIENTPALFKAPEMLALDAINYIKRSNITMNSSEDSIISTDSLDAADSRSAKKHKLSLTGCDDDDDKPIDTVVTFTARRTCDSSQDTEVELAKLYAHVQSLPESAKKKKLMKQFSEANGYHQQVHTKRKHSRSRSLGETIKRRLSRRGRQRCLNLTTDSINSLSNTCDSHDQSISITSVNSTTDNPSEVSYKQKKSSSCENLSAVKSLNDITSTAVINNHSITVDSLSESPYSLHRTSRKNLKGKYQSDGVTEDASISTVCKRLEPEGAEASPLKCRSKLPQIKQPLLLSNVQTTPERSFNIKKSKDHRKTPPGPKRVLKVIDSGIRV